MCRKFLLGTIFSLAILLTACSKDGGVTETTAEGVSVTTAEITEKTSESETEDTIIRDPVSAVQKYLSELSESENVTEVELLETRIGQSNTIVDKYYDNPQAEELGFDYENDFRSLTAVMRITA
ncbi:MAG: hypothetical protein NC395_04055 [Prevotella sp.]|nr:hypothetical protein [Prevotella sp.]